MALDADTLALKNTIKLPFATHALALSQDGKRAIATHTYVNAFSLVNLADGKITCRKADTDVKGQKYRGRYVVLDEAGNFYINYNTFRARQAAQLPHEVHPGRRARTGLLPCNPSATVWSSRWPTWMAGS